MFIIFIIIYYYYLFAIKHVYRKSALYFPGIRRTQFVSFLLMFSYACGFTG